MAKISNRVEGTIENWRGKYASPLQKFVSDIIGIGLEVGLDITGKAAAPVITPLLEQAEATGQVPPELAPLLDQMKHPTKEISGILAAGAGGTAVGGLISSTIGAWLKLLEYATLGSAKPYRFEPSASITALLRGAMTEAEYVRETADYGFTDERREQLKKLAELRLPPEAVSALWLRDKEKWGKLWQDVTDVGWTKDRVDAFKELAKVIPPLADMVRFADFSAFDPAVIEKWRAQYDAPGFIKGPLSLIGITGDWANRYWFSHWTQPPRYELGELYRRGIIDKNIVDLTYLTAGYSSYWRPKMAELLKEMPTRVDLRRFVDMGVISKGELRKYYQALGYFDEPLDHYVLWTYVYNAFPDLIARYRNGFITIEDVKAELVALGMPDKRADELIETKIKKATSERVIKERDLTKAEIYKGVKKGVITWNEGLTLLQDMGYDAAEAEFILLINAPPEETVEAETTRSLTKSDILKALRAGTIDADDAVGKLIDANYAPDDAAFLVDIYVQQIRELTKADIISSYKKEVITEQQALTWLTDLGYSDDNAKILLTDAPDPPEVAKQKALTKADITKGVRDGILTREEGYDLLLSLGYTEDDAQYLLELVPESSSQSPHTFSAFNTRVQSYRKAAGMSSTEIPEELQRAEQNVLRIKAILDRKRKAGADEAEISSFEGELANAQYAVLKVKEKLAGK